MIILLRNQKKISQQVDCPESLLAPHKVRFLKMSLHMYYVAHGYTEHSNPNTNVL